MRQEVWRALRAKSALACSILCFLVTLMVPYALIASGGTSPYSVTITYAPGTRVSRGAEVSLDIQVTNLSARKSDEWIAAVVFDFSSTHLSPLDYGVLPLDWQGVLEKDGVMTYIAGHGTSALSRGASVHLAPRIRIPTGAVDVIPPRVFLVPLGSMRSFQGPALKALDQVRHREVRPAANLRVGQ